MRRIEHGVQGDEAIDSSAGPDDATDEALLALLAGGRQDVLGLLYSRFASLIYARAAAALDPATAEEVVQDVMLSVWRAADSYDPTRASARPWILQIARYRIINELRRRQRRPAAAREGDAFELELLDSGAPDPAEMVVRLDRGERLRDAVRELPDAQREALGLAYFGEMTHEEVASHLNLPLGTAKTRIRTGIQKLRVSLAPLVAAVALLATGAATFLFWRGHGESSTRKRDERALALVTSSEVSSLRMTALPGTPAEAHATYRGIAGSTTAVVTLSHLPALPAGEVYQVWAQHGGAWTSLATGRPDASGERILIVEGVQVSTLPDALEVTIESAHGSAAPGGRVVVAWSASAQPAAPATPASGGYSYP